MWKGVTLEMLGVGVGIGAVATALAWWNGTRRRYDGAPPSPFYWPLLGHLAWVAPGTTISTAITLPRKHGPIVLLQLGSTYIVVVSTRELHKEMYGDKSRVFSGRACTLGAEEYVKYGTGVAFADYPNYSQPRKFLHSTILSAASLRPNLHIIEQELQTTLAALDKAAAEGALCNISAKIFETSMNVVGLISFSQRFTGLAEINEAVLGVFEGISTLTIADFLPFFKRFVSFEKAAHSSRVLYNWINVIYENHLKARRDVPKDLVDHIILKLEREGTSEEERSNLLKLIADVISAGGETVATSATWAIYALCGNPEATKKLQEELDSLFGKPKEEPISPHFEDFGSAPYLIAAIKESQRLYPINVFSFFRRAVEDETLGGYKIKKGAWVTLDAYHLWKSEEYWKNPEAYIPERWLPGSPEFEETTTLPYMMDPFGKGARNCIGESLGWQELVTIVAVLMHRYSFKIPPDYKLQSEVRLAHRPKGGLPVYITKRF